jgi:hypothetical protein
MSNAFSLSPPVYSNVSGSINANIHSTPYPTNTNVQPTPYPISTTSMPMPIGVGMGVGSSTSYSYPYGYSQPQIPQNVYRDSIQSAVLDKIRNRFDETIQIGNAQIDSLRKTEQDLLNGEKKIQSLIHEIKQQQNQAEVYIFFFFYSLI